MRMDAPRLRWALAVYQGSDISLESLCPHSAPACALAAAIALAAGSCYTVAGPLPLVVKERGGA
jgi:hypothetical protein